MWHATAPPQQWPWPCMRPVQHAGSNAHVRMSWVLQCDKENMATFILKVIPTNKITTFLDASDDYSRRMSIAVACTQAQPWPRSTQLAVSLGTSSCKQAWRCVTVKVAEQGEDVHACCFRMCGDRLHLCLTLTTCSSAQVEENSLSSSCRRSCCDMSSRLYCSYRSKLRSSLSACF